MDSFSKAKPSFCVTRWAHIGMYILFSVVQVYSNTDYITHYMKYNSSIVDFYIRHFTIIWHMMTAIKICFVKQQQLLKNVMRLRVSWPLGKTIFNSFSLSTVVFYCNFVSYIVHKSLRYTSTFYIYINKNYRVVDCSCC